MQSSIRRTFVGAVTVLCLGLSSAGASAHPRKHHPKPKHRLELPADYALWAHVAVCEEGGWYAPGGNYPDALGIDATNYAQFGGHPDYGHLSLRQEIAEIKVADRLIKYYGASIPDQSGCAAW